MCGRFLADFQWDLWGSQKKSNLFTDDFGKFPPLREMNPLPGGDFEGSICWDSTLASKGLLWQMVFQKGKIVWLFTNCEHFWCRSAANMIPFLVLHVFSQPSIFRCYVSFREGTFLCFPGFSLPFGNRRTARSKRKWSGVAPRWRRRGAAPFSPVPQKWPLSLWGCSARGQLRKWWTLSFYICSYHFNGQVIQAVPKLHPRSLKVTIPTFPKGSRDSTIPKYGHGLNFPKRLRFQNAPKKTLANKADEWWS